MLCSVQWNIGLKEATRGSFILPEGGFGLGLGPVGGDDLGGGPVVVVGDQDVLAEDLFFQGGAGAGVDVQGEPVVFGGVSGQLPGDDAARPGVVQDLADLGSDLVAWPPGLAAGQGGGQLVQLPACLGQSGTVTVSPKPGTAWYASRTGPSSTSVAPAAATVPRHIRRDLRLPEHVAPVYASARTAERHRSLVRARSEAVHDPAGVQQGRINWRVTPRPGTGQLPVTAGLSTLTFCRPG